jgi:hypothetical protein
VNAPNQDVPWNEIKDSQFLTKYNFSKANFYDADNNITVKKNVALGLRAQP